VPNGTALQHAAVFGMTDVVDVLVAAGAKIHSLEMAATAGGITSWPLHRFTLQSRLRVLVFAAGHQRLEVIDRLVTAGTPVNEPDAGCERLPLHTAAGNGRGASVRRLLARCADPTSVTPSTTPPTGGKPARKQQRAVVCRAAGGGRPGQLLTRPRPGRRGATQPAPNRPGSGVKPPSRSAI
jgi:ankyrin repeat protein